MSARPASGGIRTAAGCFLLTLVGPVAAISATFGLFLLPISRDLHWSRAAVSVSLLCMAVSTAICFPLAGRLSDRFGARPVILVGSTLLAGLLSLLSLPGNLFLVDPLARLLLFAGLGFASAACGAPLLARLVSGWFSHGRGLALGLVSGGGNGIGCVLMPALVAFCIERIGWHAAYLVLAGVMISVSLPAALFLLRDPPPDAAGPVVAGLSRSEAMRTTDFWLILLMLALGAGALTAIFTHAAPILLDRGVPADLAVASVSVIALSGSAWQPVMGAILDRTGDPRWLAPPFLLAALGLALMGGGSGPAAILGGAVLVGAAIGSDYAAVPLLVGRLFGLRAFGEISATLFGVNAVVLGLAPLLADLGFDRFGSYRPTLWMAAACLFGCAGCGVGLSRFKANRTDARPVRRRRSRP